MEPRVEPRETEERWILARLDATRAELEADLAVFDFSHAVQSLYRLTFDDFCDWYAEAIKPRLYDRDEEAPGPRSRRWSGSCGCCTWSCRT